MHVGVEVELGEDGAPEIVGPKNQVVVMVPGVDGSFDETVLGWNDSFGGGGDRWYGLIETAVGKVVWMRGIFLL